MSVVIVLVFIIIGLFMLSDIWNVNFDDFIEVVFVFLIIVMMLLIYSIVEGLVFGFILYIVIKLFIGC